MGLIADRLTAFSETRFDRAAWLNDDDYENMIKIAWTGKYFDTIINTAWGDMYFHITKTSYAGEFILFFSD